MPHLWQGPERQCHQLAAQIQQLDGKGHLIPQQELHITQNFREFSFPPSKALRPLLIFLMATVYNMQKKSISCDI